MAIHIEKKRGSKKGERSVVQKKARITLQSTDVLLGRGGIINLFEGNENFRAIVRSHKKSYQEACRGKKGLISRQIIRKIEQQEPPGRFLKREKGGYSLLEFKKALKKTSTALRDCKNNKSDSVVVKLKHNHEQWAKMLERLQAYQKEHNGSCNVQQGYPQDPQLGTWISMQRHHYKKGLLAKERCDQLESIGFVWTVPERNEWTKMFKRLQAYQKAHNGQLQCAGTISSRSKAWLLGYDSARPLQERPACKGAMRSTGDNRI